ncbi:hypothetical protein [Mycolicibacter algericus]|uniref:Carotenoid 1,2-hydratase n=2 Tax=Mycolicibacter algericus TaxID=1288388 RepID=A0A7I9Y8R3_MYCAL|nr:hypothetical protein [Mycolicibacter algericus]OQZ96082.1 hypothetical protein BST10_13690 [Mycolicibacter algericus DSM 45454]GFG85071.1 hypothetical protein MALGJ_17470 [Mycolicibacter algericus]
MLTPFDDYPVHQTPVALAHAGNGHPDHYDRFWFNGYTEDFYFAVALGIYPNRGVIDAAFSVVSDGTQQSVFASGRAPLDRTQTAVGPIRIEIVEPLRINRVIVDAPEHGLAADVTFCARTAGYEEPRQTRYAGTRLAIDMTRASQLGRWSGSVDVNGATHAFDQQTVYGTKDRSWGLRPVGLPAAAAPEASVGQLFFLWAPLNFEDIGVHYLTFEDHTGAAWARSGVVLPILGPSEPVYGPQDRVEHVDISHTIDWAPGLRRSQGARLEFRRGGSAESIELEPLLTFRMKGAGYFHPQWSHGLWHDELAVGGERLAVGDLDNLSLDNIHVQQVMRARWGERTGIGVLEQLAVGPHEPSGFTGLVDVPAVG